MYVSLKVLLSPNPLHHSPSKNTSILCVVEIVIVVDFVATNFKKCTIAYEHTPPHEIISVDFSYGPPPLIINSSKFGSLYSWLNVQSLCTTDLALLYIC